MEWFAGGLVVLVVVVVLAANRVEKRRDYWQARHDRAQAEWDKRSWK